MTNNTSLKQITANKENSKKGGVKTEEGKNISSQNSLKHGCLSQQVLAHEKEQYFLLYGELVDELKPSTIIDRVLIERIAVHILQLNRISFAKLEFVKAYENPGKSKSFFDEISLDHIEVLEEAYEPKVKQESIETLLMVYHRYEVSAENRLHKAIREYKLNR